MRQNLQILSTESSEVKDKFKLSDEKLILRFQEGDINASVSYTHLRAHET